MSPLFTHTFEIGLKADGSQFLQGEVEFNEDGEVSFKIEECSIPLAKKTTDYFNEIMSLLQRIYYGNGGIKRIEIIQKKS